MSRLKMSVGDLGVTGVHATLKAIIEQTRVVPRSDEPDEEIALVQALSNEIIRLAFGARRAIVVTYSEDGVGSRQEIKYVDDDRTRFEAATKMLEMLHDAELRHI
jgi:hypothetical protein